jgi:hypothetical protein
LISSDGISENKTRQFFCFLEDQGIPKHLMKLENELLLYEYVAAQSALFLKQIEK